MAIEFIKRYSYVSQQITEIRQLLGLTGKFGKRKLQNAIEKMGTVKEPNPDMEAPLKEKEGFARNLLLVISEVRSFDNERIMQYILRSTICQQSKVPIKLVSDEEELISYLDEFSPNKEATMYNFRQMMMVSHYAVTSLGYTIACYSWDELINNFGMNWYVEKCYYYEPIASFICVFHRKPVTIDRMRVKRERKANGLTPIKHKKYVLKGN